MLPDKIVLIPPVPDPVSAHCGAYSSNVPRVILIREYNCLEMIVHSEDLNVSLCVKETVQSQVFRLSVVQLKVLVQPAVL